MTSLQQHRNAVLNARDVAIIETLDILWENNLLLKFTENKKEYLSRILTENFNLSIAMANYWLEYFSIE